MDCADARKVYLSDNPTKTIIDLFPLAFAELQLLVDGLAGKVQDKFNELVHQRAVDVHNGRSNYFIRHRTDAEDSEVSRQLQEVIGDETSRRLLEKFFSDLNSYGPTLHFSLICCNSCTRIQSCAVPARDGRDPARRCPDRRQQTLTSKRVRPNKKGREQSRPFLIYFLKNYSLNPSKFTSYNIASLASL